MKLRVLIIGFALAATIHALGAFYFCPPGLVLGDAPFGDLDFELRVGAAAVVGRASASGAPLPAYDPSMLAGTPVGAFADTASPIWQAFVTTAYRLGASPTRAFNLFVAFAHLLAPLALLAAGFAFGLRGFSLLATYGLAVSLWFFDASLHYSWWSGSPDFALAGALTALTVALGHRWLTSSSIASYVLLTVAAVVTLAVHVHPLLLAAPALGACWYENRREIGPLRHGLTALFVIVTLGVAVALHGARLSLGLTNDAGALGLGTLSHLFGDLLGFNLDTRVAGGVAIRSGFRLATLGGAGIALALWRKTGDDRYRAALFGLGGGLALTYLGGYVLGPLGLRPYRFIGVTALLATLPAGALVGELIARKSFSGLPRQAYGIIAIVAIAAIPRLARDVVHFTPALNPTPEEIPAEKPHIADIIGFGSIGYPRHRDYRHQISPADFARPVEWLADWTPSRGRVLVEYPPLAEHLAWKTRAQIVGGSTLRPREHRSADYFARYPEQDPAPKDIAAYLDRYAVGLAIVDWNITPGEEGYVTRLLGAEDIFARKDAAQPFMLLESKREIDWLERGSAEVALDGDTIHVRQASPGSLVLRFHHHESLRCTPDCEIRKHPLEDDPVGFIEISADHPERLSIAPR